MSLTNSRVKEIFWSGYNWVKQEDWSNFDLRFPDKYVNGDLTVIEDNLKMKVDFLPMIFSRRIDEVWVNFEPRWAWSLITNKERFTYGEFEIIARMPKGKNLWPSFWLWGWESWPPEIDVFEGYTGCKGKFLRFSLRHGINWGVENNFHVLPTDKGRNMKVWSIFKNLKDPSDNFMSYKLIWTESFLKFYYDNKLVRTVKNKKILDSLRGQELRVVINNSVTNNYQEEDFKTYTQDFEIKKFTYKKY